MYFCEICEIFLDFVLHESILATFSLWERRSKSGKWSINKLMRGGVGNVIQNETSPDFRFAEVGISDY